jgi:hypothetical protein
MPEFLGDQTQYHVTLVSGDFRDDRHLKAVAQLLGVNRLAARKALEASQELAVFSGLACLWRLGSSIASIRLSRGDMMVECRLCYESAVAYWP